MAEPKTKKTNASVTDFLDKVTPEEKNKDCLELMKIFKEVTKEKPTMWGNGMIGFGTFHYKSERSTQEGDWPLTAFSPRKQNITIYIMSGLNEHTKLLEKIGKHKKTSGSCLYIQRLSDIDTDLLKQLIKASVEQMKKKYGIK